MGWPLSGDLLKHSALQRFQLNITLRSQHEIWHYKTNANIFVGMEKPQPSTP